MTEKIKSQSSSVKSASTETSASDKRKSAKNDAVTGASSPTNLNSSTSHYNTRRVATDTSGESSQMIEIDIETPTSRNFKEKTALQAQNDTRTKNPGNKTDYASATKLPKESDTNLSKTPGKPKARRRSSGIPEHKSRRLNKKASKPKMTHIDAKPGDYFYVRLKGYPLWPAIVCDESMLPNTLLKNRPVTAARADGSYREDFMDGGPKAKDRSFPVMYLFTNEFSWIPNYDLLDIDFNEVANISGTMRKDLAMARQLAAERHDLNYFKDILKKFMEAKENERVEHEKFKDGKIPPKEKTSLKEKKESSDGKKTPKKSRKSQATGLENDKLVLSDVKPKAEPEGPETNLVNANSKRPAEEILEGTPKRKTTIKLNTKAKIGNPTPKSPKAAAPKKKNKEKSEKASNVKKIKVTTPPIIDVPAEPELTAEEKRVKKEKEILFLRHKLQRGLLHKDQELKSEEMKLMSEFVEKLEAYTDLEVSIIRQTKINKVLKAILKLPNIPLEHEYRFKPRSQNLLNDWNKLLASEPGNINTSANGTIIQGIRGKFAYFTRAVHKAAALATGETSGPLPDRSVKAFIAELRSELKPLDDLFLKA